MAAFDQEFAKEKNERLTQVWGIDSQGLEKTPKWLLEVLNFMTPDGNKELADRTTMGIARGMYGGLMRLQIASLEMGSNANSSRGDVLQDGMREQITDTIRGVGALGRSSKIDERLILSTQMKLLGGVLKDLLQRSHDHKKPILRAFASSFLRRDVIALCSRSGLVGKISSDWLDGAGKSIINGNLDDALIRVDALSNLDESIFSAST